MIIDGLIKSLSPIIFKKFVKYLSLTIETKAAKNGEQRYIQKKIKK